MTRLLATLLQPDYLPRWSYVAVAIAVGFYAVLILAETATLSGDVEVLLIALFAVTCFLLAILRSKPLNIIEKAVLYVTVAILVYLDNVLLAPPRVCVIGEWTAVGLAALATIVRLRLAADRRFVLTPLDLIILFVALVVPSLPGSFAMPDGGAAGIAKLVILFYALEVLVSRVELSAMWLRLSVVAVLMGLVLRPLLSL